MPLLAYESLDSMIPLFLFVSITGIQFVFSIHIRISQKNHILHPLANTNILLKY
jgi:hypothetical protein